MRLRILYTLVGLVLGALAGLAVVFQVFAVAAGVSWLFLFGDSPWPAGAERYLLGIPLMAGVAVLALGVGIGYAAGRRYDAAPRPQRARRRGYGLLLAGLALWLLVLVLATWQHERESSARATAAVQEVAYQQLLQSRHVVTGVREIDAGADELRLTLGLDGSRTGAYRLTWRLDDGLYRVTLLSGERQLDLGPAAAPVDLAFETATLAARYRETVLKGRPDKVVVDGTLRLKLSLEPVLDDDERRALPAREIGNLERGLSALRFETEVDVPVRLDLTMP
jgi:F0F1-type ATP synthase membrane subunit c/vacuolar-type H+-ATPase subunit K